MVAPDNSDCPLVAGVGDRGRGLLLLIAVVHDGGMLSGELFLSGGGNRGIMRATAPGRGGISGQ